MPATSRVITIRVKPRAHRDEIHGDPEQGYEVRVTVPPTGGAANERAIRLLATHLHIAPSRLKIIAGHKSRIKRVAVT